VRIAWIAAGLILTGCQALKTPESHAWLALHAVDTIQTYHAAQQPECFHEGDSVTRRVIGTHPSDAEVAAWSIGSAALHLGVTELLLRNEHPALAKAWQYVRIGITTSAIAGNYSAGIRIGSPNKPHADDCVQPLPPRAPDPIPRPIG
jgi:hypothetical protein